MDLFRILSVMNKKVSILTTLIACVLVFIATYAIPKFSKTKTPLVPDTTVTAQTDPAISMDQIRLKRYEYIQPLLMANLMTESNTMQSLKTKLDNYVAQLKNDQKIEDITVYVRKMNNGDWFCINPNQTYNPASMSKLIYILTYLKEAEYNPAVLNKRLYFAKHYSEGNQQNIKNFTLNENSYYTVKELMTYMIRYSDNDATLLLSQNMNVAIYNQIFVDLDLPSPPTAGEYFITAVDYSKFFRVLYNASYIRPDYSEFALGLLTESTFNDGIRSGVDQSVKMAHKFGERIIGNRAQLHEFGIVFYKGDPYMLGVMSKGNSLGELTQILAQISRMTYEEFLKMPNS
jgi:beta-lactamase class A